MKRKAPKRRRSPHEDYQYARMLAGRANMRQQGLCYWCKKPMNGEYTAEHVKPKHAGGKTRADNIVAAHAKCNNERHPEMQQRGGISYSIGDNTPRSPFEILRSRP